MTEAKTAPRHGMIAEGKSRMTFLLDTETKEKLRAIAESENRSLSNFTAMILKRFVDTYEKQN